MCYLNPIDTEDIQVIKSGDLVPGDIVKVPLAQTKVIYTFSEFTAIKANCLRYQKDPITFFSDSIFM